jgi:hypothetical protein
VGPVRLEMPDGGDIRIVLADRLHLACDGIQSLAVMFIFKEGREPLVP